MDGEAPFRDDDPAAPWMVAKKYNGMTPSSRRKSWEASQAQKMMKWATHPNGHQRIDVGMHAGGLNEEAQHGQLLPLPFIKLSNWIDQPVPPRQWAVPGIPLRQPTIFSGEGGTGKTI